MTSSLRHSHAVLAMVLVTLLWSMAGVVTRHVHGVPGFELTFWRSAFQALALGLVLLAMCGPRALMAAARSLGLRLCLSSVCWAVMFTAFMLALSLTTVANVLVTMAMAPVFTAAIAWQWQGVRPPRRTGFTILAAVAGLLLLYGSQWGSGQPMLGTWVALAVPLVAAINWNVMQRQAGQASDARTGFLLALCLGSVLSALVMAPLAWPFHANGVDRAWMALLGVAQLAIPCSLAIVVAASLPASEVALLSLLEVVFGVLWPWMAGSEVPRPVELAGAVLVLGALAANEGLALRERRRALGSTI